MNEIRAYVDSRRRTEPDLAQRFDGVLHHLEAPAGAGMQGRRLSELSSLHDHMLELHLRATAKTMGKGPFYAYEIQVLYPLQLTSITNHMAVALAEAATRQQ
jgi:hypothetical protein